MKDLLFLGDSLIRLRDSPTVALRKAGYALRQLQRDEEPSDWKNLSGMAPGIRELRL
jgi:phage-related protein